jgi:hypothetical protein
LPYLGQQVQDSGLPLPNPAQYNFLFYGVTLLLMMRFRPQGFLPDRQRQAELAVVAVAEAEAEMVEAAAEAESDEVAVHELEPPVDLDNLGTAPPGQDETGPDARAPEVPGEARDL